MEDSTVLQYLQDKCNVFIQECKILDDNLRYTKLILLMKELRSKLFIDSKYWHRGMMSEDNQWNNFQMTIQTAIKGKDSHFEHDVTLAFKSYLGNCDWRENKCE